MSDIQVVERPTSRLPGTTLSVARLPDSVRRMLRSAVAPLVCLLLLAPSVCWVVQDRSVWPWDQAYYARTSVELYYTLRLNPANWPAAMAHAIPQKPPGLTWLGQFVVPLGKRIGSIDHALLSVILLLQFITLVLIYRIGTALSPKQGRTTALVGCAMVAAAPLFVGLSHQYLVEPLQTLVVAWFYYCAIMSPRWGRLCILSNLIPATALAMLAKTTSPLYCLLPGLMAAAQLLRRRSIPTDRAGKLTLALRLGGVALGIGLLAGAAVWYWVNWQTVRQHAFNASFGDGALPYGSRDIFSRKFAFWFAALRVGLFTPPLFWMGAFLVLMGIAVWVSRLRQGEESQRLCAADCLALLAGLQVAILLVAIAFTINEDTRFLTAAAPAVAVLVMWAAARVPLRVAGVVFAAAALVQWGYVHSITLGLTDWKGHNRLVPVQRDPTQAEEVARVVRLTSELAARYNTVGVALPWCNHDSFAYYASKHKLATQRHAYYTSLGYGQKDLDQALARIDALNIVYFISVEEEYQPKPADFLNLVSAPVLAKVREDDRFERLPFLSKCGIVVFKRTASNAPPPLPPSPFLYLGIKARRFPEPFLRHYKERAQQSPT